MHHGYRRPGVGYIIGDCPGVGYEPYETGTGACDHYLSAYVIPKVRGTQNWLVTLHSPEGPNKLSFEHYDAATRRVIRDPLTGERETVRLTRAEAEALAAGLPEWDRERYDWARRIRIEIAQAESTLKFWNGEEDRIEKLIETWRRQPLRTIEQEIERQEASKAERDAARSHTRDQKVAGEVAKIQKRIDSAVRNRNSATLADIYESHKLQQVSGWRLKNDEALALLDRDHVWRAFGLLTPNGYLHGAEARERLSEMTYGLKVPASRPGVRYDHAPLPWPDALGGGTSKTR